MEGKYSVVDNILNIWTRFLLLPAKLNQISLIEINRNKNNSDTEDSIKTFYRS